MYMSYEQEQAEYRKQLEKIEKRIKELDSVFREYPNLKFSDRKFGGREYNVFDLNLNEEYLRSILRDNYGDVSTWDDSVLMLEYKLCKHKKRELEFKLKESKTDRRVYKTLDFIDGIIPRHVSGGKYYVKDGDGCAIFYLWLLVVGAIILFIWYIISEAS